eukprot:5901570-Prymnesium_polylepis.1
MAGYPLERELAAAGVTTREGFPLEVGMVERSLHGLRDGWAIDSIVDVRETGRRATGHTREYR